MHSLSIRKLLLVLCMSALLISTISASSSGARKRVLVISLTKGFHHSAINLGEEVLRDLGQKSGLWVTDFARTDKELKEKTTPDALNTYSVIIFNNTTGDLPLADKEAFLNWVKAGGGVIGIHAATDTFHGWRPYIEMMGGEFAGHGPQAEVKCIVEDRKHPATKDLPATFKVLDEIYLTSNFSRSVVRGLITLDRHPNTGEPGDYPIAWCRNYEKGRVLYTSLGHRDDVWQSDLFQKHLLGAMRWALRLEDGDAQPVSPSNPVTRKEKNEGFRALFNTKDLTGWHLRDEESAPWKVENGMLVIGKDGTDLISDEKFRDFVLRYEYMIPEGGNSGVYLRGRYEIQILDDFKQKTPDIRGNGSVYEKIAPSRFASRIPGEWQTVDVKMVGQRVTIILNGVKIIDNQEVKGRTGAGLDDNECEPGPVLLQGNHRPVAFRNIRIKELK